MSLILSYDGSFDGFLTAVFCAYEYKLETPILRKDTCVSESFFDTIEQILTDTTKASRVWKGLSAHASSAGKSNLFRAFLSEISDIEDSLFHFIKRTLAEKAAIDKDYSDPHILTISKTVKMVGREKHRMDAFVRFKLTKDDLYFATVEPDFNVLPLLVNHFKKRYADQCWLIYDLKRNYGIHYNLNKVATVVLSDRHSSFEKMDSDLFFSEEEMDFQALWKSYFNSTNIVARKNMRLHIQHVPKRYWKYLSEKSYF